MSLISFELLFFIYLALFSLLSSFGHGFNPKPFNMSKLQSGSSSGWSTGQASWYGNPSGAGSDACGYQNAVDSAPFSSLITAAASSVYTSDKACGVCYQVKCSSTAICSSNSVTVIITDECPGCDSQSIVFDLSGTSFGTMAHSGDSEQLRNVGIEEIQYRRKNDILPYNCNFGGVSVAFRVDPGSNGNYFATAIEYENGDGLSGVEMMDSSSSSWLNMKLSWGAVWKVDAPSGLKPPFSITLNSPDGKNVVANNVIPANYKPGQTYRSISNF